MMEKPHGLIVGILTMLGIIFLVPTDIAWAEGRNLQTYLMAISGFINDSLIPFFFALAILFLMVNIVRYYIIDASDSYSREQARKYVMYAIIALVFLSSIWGVISIVIRSFGVQGDAPVCPDYNQNCDNSSFGTRPGGEFSGTSISPNNPANNSGFTTSPLGEFDTR